MSDATELVAELRGFAEGSESARATLMRDAAEMIEHLDGLAEERMQMLVDLQKKYVADGDALFLARKAAERKLAAVSDLAAEHWDWKAGRVLAERLREIVSQPTEQQVGDRDE